MKDSVGESVTDEVAYLLKHPGNFLFKCTNSTESQQQNTSIRISIFLRADIIPKTLVKMDCLIYL